MPHTNWHCLKWSRWNTRLQYFLRELASLEPLERHPSGQLDLARRLEPRAEPPVEQVPVQLPHRANESAWGPLATLHKAKSDGSLELAMHHLFPR